MRIRALLLACLALPAAAQDWTNLGGNALRNGLSGAHGPTDATPRWTNTDDPALITWAPFVADGTVFTVREAGFPQSGGPAGDAIVAYDVTDGSEAWRTTLPFGGDTTTEWIAWIAGVQAGTVYASRASHMQPGPIRALDASDGSIQWTSALSVETFAYDGCVFAPNGDLLLADWLQVARIRATDGGTVWSTPRSCSVSGNCGPAATATAVFVDQVGPGGQVVSKLDIATGAVLYSSPVMPGFLAQNVPFLSPDGGTVYYVRAQNNPITDFLYAFQDTGAALVQLWMRPVRWTTSHEAGIGPDGSIYTFLPTNEFVRLDPADGSELDTAGVLAPIGASNLSPKTAVDADGNVYVSNGWASTPASDGRLWAFNQDLSQNLFTLNLQRPNQGGPALAADGTLVIADLGGVYAYGGSTPPVFYCTPKTSSAGCVTTIGTSDPAAGPVSGANDYSVLAASVQGAKNGLFFFSLSGSAAIPFSGGTLCMNPPLGRTAIQFSGGSGSLACDGAYALVTNDGTSPYDPGPGGTVWMQTWYRDPAGGAGNLGTALSDAVELTY